MRSMSLTLPAIYSVFVPQQIKEMVLSFGRKCWIKNSRKRLVGTGSAAGKLYKLNCKVLKSLKEEANVAGEKEASEKMDLWHRRLAHVTTQDSYVN